jgi:hypothetical protein
MSYEDGWAAMNLEMPARVPRTEYSAHEHWDLLRSVTGMDIDADSPWDVKQEAHKAFVGPTGWNYDFFWSVWVYTQFLAKCRTDMGHAEYAADGSDRRQAIISPFKEPLEVLSFDPVEIYGEIDEAELTSQFEWHYQFTRDQNPNCVNMTGMYITLVSGLIEIFGWEMLLLAMGTDPVAFGNLTNRYARWMQPFFNALGNTDIPVVMVHDDIVWNQGPFVRPGWYREYIFPNYHKYFRPLIDSGKKIMFTSDGNYTQFIDDIADCGIHGFVLEPTTDMKYVAEKYGNTHVFIGNADTRVLLRGEKSEIRAEVKRCMDIGKNCPGFFMAVGNHIPPNTPVENALYYNEVYLELSCR